MTQLFRRLLAKPECRAALIGASSVLNLGGSGKYPQVMVFRAKSPCQSMRDAWKTAVGEFNSKPEFNR